MDFPIVELLDNELASEWLLAHFHPKGLSYPHCETSVKEAHDFRETKTSKLVVYRCHNCGGIYNLYSGTTFQHKQLSPAQVVLLRRVCKGESSASIGREIGITRQAVTSIRRELHQNAGTVGRESGRVCLRVVYHTDQDTLETHVYQFTTSGSQVYTNEWSGYNHLIRPHATVCYSHKEWPRDDDGDGIREVYRNTTEGMWTTVRNFLRTFWGVHKKFLADYIAIFEFRINIKRVTPLFISQLVARTNS